MASPDIYDPRRPSYVLCPTCRRKTYYARNTDRYVCPVHGPVVTSQMLPRAESRQ